MNEPTKFIKITDSTDYPCNLDGYNANFKVKTRYFAEIKIYNSKKGDIMIIPISSDFNLKDYKLDIIDVNYGIIYLVKNKKSDKK